MPSKNYNGNNPLGRARIKSNGLDASGAFARVETQIGRLQPSISLQTGSLQLPNGRVQVPRRARRGGGGGTSQWKVSLAKDENGDCTATISEGKIYEGLLDLNQMVFETEGVGEAEKSKGQGSVVVANDVVCILYTYKDGDTPAKLEFSVFPSGVDFADWEYKDENEADPPEIVATRYPLAKILDTGETDADNNPILQTEQMASNNLALVSICKNGYGILSFTPF